MGGGSQSWFMARHTDTVMARLVRATGRGRLLARTLTRACSSGRAGAGRNRHRWAPTITPPPPPSVPGKPPPAFPTDGVASAAGVASATIRPPAMMIAREHTASTSSRICVEITIAFCGAICSISRAPHASGSGPPVGRLVEHQHRRIVQQRLSQPDPALEAFRQCLHRLQPHALQRRQAERVIDPIGQFRSRNRVRVRRSAETLRPTFPGRSVRLPAGTPAPAVRLRCRFERRGPGCGRSRRSGS